jgi:hypothetical protein
MAPVRLVDTYRRERFLVDKAPVFGVEAAPPMAPPPTAVVRGTVVDLLPNESAGEPPLVRVSTALDGVSTEDGTSEFTLSGEQLRRPG